VPRRAVGRVCVVVCDSWGVGDAPDADAFGDQGANTLAHVAEAVGGLRVPALEGLGLGLVDALEGVSPRADDATAHGAATEVSAGKDTTTGHWEMMGVPLDEAFPVYPEGFPAEVIDAFERGIGRTVLGNVPASGTEIIAALGSEHLATGRPIVYTSADSVFQIATHVEVVPLEVLYVWCEVARAILTGAHRVGRVIARPFDGRPGAFRRRPERRDYSVPPPARTVLDHLVDAGRSVFAIGKIQDIFDHRGISDARYSDSNDHGVELTIDALTAGSGDLVFTNLVDFDSKYGHRNDPRGYAAAIEAFDRAVPNVVDALDDGVLFVTGDHGCDPTTASTDHTRERTPLLVAGLAVRAAVDLGVRATFADLGATVAALLGVETPGTTGESFAAAIGHST
jgi:phosphopentomutase